MSAEEDSAIQLPLSYEVGARGFVYLKDASGRRIAALFGTKQQRLDTATFLVDAAQPRYSVGVDLAKGPDRTAYLCSCGAYAESEDKIKHRTGCRLMATLERQLTDDGRG